MLERRACFYKCDQHTHMYCCINMGCSNRWLKPQMSNAAVDCFETITLLKKKLQSNDVTSLFMPRFTTNSCSFEGIWNAKFLQKLLSTLKMYHYVELKANIATLHCRSIDGMRCMPHLSLGVHQWSRQFFKSNQHHRRYHGLPTNHCNL